MELIRTFSSVPPLRAIPISSQSQGYFGVVAAASNTISSFYQDTSFQKPHLQQFLKHKRQSSLQPKLQKAIKTREQIHAKYLQRIHRQERIQSLLHALQIRFEQIETMNQAAKVIQKAYRSHMTARAADQEYIQLRKQELQTWTDHLESLHSVWMYKTGLMPQIASKKIGKAIKRHLFRGKLARITKTYKIICNMKIFQAFQVIRRQIYVLKARNAVKYKKFKIYRKQRLVEIKRRLAVLVIDNFWLQEKFNMKLLRQRIRRYKRKLRKQAELQNKKQTAEQDNQSQNEQKKTLENQQEDSEQEELREKLEAQRRQKIRMGKISYNVPKQKKKSFLPYLKKPQQPISPNLIPNQNIPIPPKYKKFSKKLFDKLGRPLFRISQKPKTTPKGSGLPPRYRSNDTPRYMQPTLSSRPPPTPSSQSNQSQIQSRRLKNNFMKMTKTHSLKKNQKHSRSISVDNRPIWQPALTSKENSKIELDQSQQSIRRKVSFQRFNSRPNNFSSIKLISPNTQTTSVVPKEAELHFEATPAFTSTLQEALPELTQFLSLYPLKSDK